MFGLGELGDVERGVAEGDEPFAFRQFDWVEELLAPRHELTQTGSRLSSRLWLCGTHAVPLPPVKQ